MRPHVKSAEDGQERLVQQSHACIVHTGPCAARLDIKLPQLNDPLGLDRGAERRAPL